MIGEISVLEGIGKMGTDRRRVSVFFRVKTKKTIQQLIHESEGLVKELEVRIHKKYTLPENVVKTGYVLGLNLRFANLKRHKELITKLTGIDERDYELRKERVCENGYPSQCVVAYAVQSKVRQVDKDMKKIHQTMELAYM